MSCHSVNVSFAAAVRLLSLWYFMISVCVKLNKWGDGSELTVYSWRFHVHEDHFLRAPNLSGTCSIYLLCRPTGTETENTGTESLRFLMEWKSAISINVVLFCFYRFISLSNRCELYKRCFITKSSPAYFEHYRSSATITSVLATRLLLLAFCPKRTVRAPAGPPNSGLCSIRLRTDLVSGMLVTEDMSRFPHNTRAFSLKSIWIPLYYQAVTLPLRWLIWQVSTATSFVP